MTGPVVVAAGGGLGEPVSHWRRTWPDATFMLFEPHPDYCEALRSRFADDLNVIVSGEALSDRTGRATFYVSRTPMASSLLPFNENCPAYYPDWATVKRVLVQTITLDDWARRMSVPRIAFVELDLQGGELAALRGAEGLLQAGAIDALLVEVFHTDLYRGAPLAGEVREYMAGLGYVAVEEKSQEGSQFADILFRRGQA